MLGGGVNAFRIVPRQSFGRVGLSGSVHVTFRDGVQVGNAHGDYRAPFLLTFPVANEPILPLFGLFGLLRYHVVNDALWISPNGNRSVERRFHQKGGGVSMERVEFWRFRRG